MKIILSKDAICAIFAKMPHPEYESFELKRALDLVAIGEHDGLLTRAIMADIEAFLEMLGEQPEKRRLKVILWRHWFEAAGGEANLTGITSQE